MSKKSFRTWVGTLVVAIACMLFFVGFAQGAGTVTQSVDRGGVDELSHRWRRCPQRLARHRGVEARR